MAEISRRNDRGFHGYGREPLRCTYDSVDDSGRKCRRERDTPAGNKVFRYILEEAR